MTGSRDWQPPGAHHELEYLAVENDRLRAKMGTLERVLRMIDAAVFNDNGDVTYDTHTMFKAHRLARLVLYGDGDTNDRT